MSHSDLSDKFKIEKVVYDDHVSPSYVHKVIQECICQQSLLQRKFSYQHFFCEEKLYEKLFMNLI